MRLTLVVLWSLLTCTINPTTLCAHDTAINYTVNGYFSDASNGETLIGATVSVEELGIGVTSNAYGFW